VSLPPKFDHSGAYLAMPAEAYHHASGVSNSMLKRMDPTPAHFKAAQAEPFEVTPAMIMGTLTHAMVLEPDKPLPKVALVPDAYIDAKGVEKPWTFASNTCKDWRKAQEAEGRLILTATQRQSVIGMVASIAAHPVASNIIATASMEVSLFACNPKFEALFGADNPLLKARLDIAPEGNFLADVKTCEDAGEDFSKTIFTFGYYMQAAFYIDLWNILHPHDPKTHFVFIAVEKSAPYAVRVVRLSQRCIEAGRGTYLQRLTRYVECTQSGQWPGYSTDIEEVDIPAWAHASLERKAS
jgi:hypothetical protein